MRLNPIVSVIIPCRGHTEELKGCLRALENQRPLIKHEIIVVDSSPDDNSLHSVASAFPHVHVVTGPTALLAGEARNLGAGYAKGTYLAFIDADCIPERGWLHAARTALDQDYLFVGGPVLNVFPFHPIAASDNLLQLPDFTSYRPSGMASHLPGGNMAADKSAFYEIGGFPSGIAAGEDTMISTAAAGKWPQKVYFSEDMRVCHYGRTRIRTFLQHQYQFGYTRSMHGLRISTIYIRMGQSIGFSMLMALKRLAYFCYRSICWRPVCLLRIYILLPFLSMGLAAWAIGFRQGCQTRARQKKHLV